MISGGIFQNFGKRRLWAGALLASVAIGSLSVPMAAWAQAVTAEDVRSFDIAPQSVAGALADFGRQSGLQVSMDAEQVRGLSTAGVNGSMTASQALDRLLASTGLMARIEGNIVSLRSAATAGVQNATGAVQLGTLRVEGQQGGGAGRDDGASSGGAAGGADEIFAAPRAVSIITREEMDRTPARHASDMLVATPGVSSAVNRLDPGLSVNIRGMQDFGRVNMMIDGMRQNFVRNGHQQRNGQIYVDPELISAVTIERGPRTDVHGAGAIAGSVNFQTLDFSDLLADGDKLGARLRGSTGLGAEGNGVNFVGSAALAGRVSDRIEILGAYSRRSIGDYDIGKHGGSGNAAMEFLGEEGLQTINQIKYARQVQDSALFKARLNLAEDHWLQFSYVGTWLDYDNVSDTQGSELDEDQSPWRRLGDSRITSDNFALDYRFRPDSPWIDLNVKVYTVNTRNRNYTVARENPVSQSLTDVAWDFGFCETDPIPASWITACSYGFGTDQSISTRTWGVQLDNTSRFDLARGTTLAANYGAEFFRDRANSTIAIDRDGRSVETYNQYGQGEQLNPKGRRSMASVFANFSLENDFYTISAGIRYDRYWLQGDTQVPGVQSSYQTRFERFVDYTCSRTTASAVRLCEGARTGGEQWVIENLRNYLTSGLYAPQWIDTKGLYDYHVDRAEGRFLPSISAAIRPTGWLELYASWAKSWRPPAINESLMVGGHPGDPLTNMYPNPFADPEKTSSWEIGANLTFNDIAKSGDVFFAKLGYFDTRATEYLYTSINNNLPGANMSVPLGLGNVVFVNNRAPMHFRGLEIESRYDAGTFYAGVNATLYTGGRNGFCQDLYPVGVGTSRFDQPGENGSITPQRQTALDAGFPSWQAWAEVQQVCGDSVFNSVAGDRLDKASATIGVRLFDRRLDTGFRLIYSGSGGLITYEDESAKAWESYATVDWYGSFLLNSRVRVYASAENLFDRRYIDGSSDIIARTWAPGRTVQAGLQVKF